MKIYKNIEQRICLKFCMQMKFRVRNREKCYRRLTVNRRYQKHVHMSATVHLKAVEIWQKFFLALVSYQHLQLKLTSIK